MRLAPANAQRALPAGARAEAAGAGRESARHLAEAHRLAPWLPAGPGDERAPPPFATGTSRALAGLPGARRSRRDAAFSFENAARAAGLVATTVFGGQKTNTFLLETTGCGAALFDYDGDGWLDVFLVNGTTLEGFPRGQEPTGHLYRNRGTARSRT